MDFINTKKQKKLYVGTESREDKDGNGKGVILLIDIANELEIDVHEDAMNSMNQEENNNMMEEEKENYDYDQDYSGTIPNISDEYAQILQKQKEILNE